MVIVHSDVVVLVVQAGLNHVGQGLGTGVSLNGVQSQVDTRHNHRLLGVEEFGADGDFVDGDRGLDRVVLESSGEH